MVARFASGENKYYYASPLGDYVWVIDEDRILLCDRALNVLFEYPREYNDEYGIYFSNPTSGPNVLLSLMTQPFSTEHICLTEPG